MDFCHLHVHSEYSVLDGMCRIDELFRTASDMGMSALAVTDHGSTSGLYVAQKAGQKYGIKPILGTEFYYERETDSGNGHLVVLAKNNTGLRNIFKLQEYAYVHNFYRKPRIKWEMLKENHEGLIVTTACLASTINQLIISGKGLEAFDWAKKFQTLFGDDFYLEIQPNSIPEQLEVNQYLLHISKQLGIKVVASNDVHYIHESDTFPHEVMLALQTNSKMSDEKRWRFSANDFWLKSAEEMKSTFIGCAVDDVAASLQTTLEIADKCNATITTGKYLPKYYALSEGQTERSLLAEKIMQGAKKKGFADNKHYMRAVQKELDVIDRNGYSGYFLIVQDYVNSARENGIIVGDGRGSGAGSKVAFLTDISRIEPSKYDLLFERFMADGRSPDFDVDFSNQDVVFEDLQSKYGIENVARIVAFGTLTPRSVCRKVMNVFEHPPTVINAISKLIPDLCPSMQQAYQDAPELLDYRNKYKLEFEVIERLEGLVSHESQHAGGVIIYPGLSSILPIKSKADDRTKRIVAWDKYMLEDIGHYKFDILGLETLPIIKRCLDSIKSVTGEEIDLYNIDFEDERVYDMLCNGHVSGVFQLANQSGKVIEQQPRNFKDLIAINALIRPGTGDWHEYIARRKGKRWDAHPLRLPYLEETEGLITYQEQFLLDCKVLAGWDIAFSDKCVRKNKAIAEDVQLRSKFINDCIRNGIDDSTAKSVWSEIEISVSGGYSFNKSHSASYAVLSYQTAWLKCYFPEHFYASLMSSEKTDGDGQNAIAQYIMECKALGIKILPPDINNSNDSFNVLDDGISYRITTIKHVGETAIKHIVNLRPIQSFQDFIDRRKKSEIKKNVLINLVKAGCFDFDNPNRSELLWLIDMMDRTKTQIKNEHICPKYAWNETVKAEWEKEVLGMYLSSHPMEKYGFEPLSVFGESNRALQGGKVYEIRQFKDKNQNNMAFVWLDTLFGNLKVIVFANLWKQQDIRDVLEIGNIVLLHGKVSGNDILLNDVELLEKGEPVSFAM